MNTEDFLVIGMSPGNGYFKQDIVNQILEKYLLEYKNIGIFIPDVPAASTYIALGYSESVALGKKAIPQGNALKNKVLRFLEDKSLDKDSVKIFDWRKENIESNSDYINAFGVVKSLYETNKLFRSDINETTEKVLVDNPFKKQDIGEKEIVIATHYILAEFAFMLFLPKYLNFSKFFYGYHKPWPVFEKFIAGFYDEVKKESIEFLMLSEFS